MRRPHVGHRSPTDGQSRHYNRRYLVVGPAAPRDYGPLLCGEHAEETWGRYCVDHFVCGRADSVYCRTEN